MKNKIDIRVKEIISKYEEEEKISNIDIDECLKLLTKKEISLEETCELLSINMLEVLGSISRIRSQGTDILYYNINDSVYLKNIGPVKQNVENLKLYTDEENKFKALVISDTRFGAKEQQLELIKNQIENAKKQGIKNIILCGNITEGIYPSNSPYFDSLFLHGTENQVDYVVENFPKIDGMTTYFITGPKDETHLKKNDVDIGAIISSKRDDMIYLGRNEKDITIDNISVKIANLKAKKTYTVSYRCENLVKSIRSEDKSDILLYGGLLQQDKFKYRDMNCLSIPSICGTTPEMDDKYSNTVGSWILEVESDNKGNLKKLLTTSCPNYKTSKNEYKKYKPSKIELNSVENEKTKLLNISYAKKILKICKNNMNIIEFAKIMNCSIEEGMGLIEFCKMYYFPIDLVFDKENNVYLIKKYTQEMKKNIYKPDMDSLNYEQILVVSDTHLGNKSQQLHLLNNLYKEASERGIDKAFHVGDLVDGDYSSHRREHPYQVFLHGFDEQADYVCNMYPYVNGITTYYILGSHDETHQKNGGARINTWVSKARKDMIFLGQDEGKYNLNGINMFLDHPGGGSANGLSYKPQKRIEEFDSGSKPNIHLIGHYHKSYYFLYRNIHCIEVPALCAKTQFQRKMNLTNAVGGYFLHIYYDKKGNVQYFCPEEVLYNKNDFWEENGKDKNKVKQLYI